ncbi:hypothetical protein [Actinomadura sp. HBU206391]|uniref:hypothetical protein n=1 Tax=Actinomadura sp. HBU206391 TaxID=2731692 RepID=UPI0016501B46|nr:hypothetical protein [Actinomadura sp. HBU206391]MBC6458405.1 hypothetical protein [Actinomadura sp. HBU206391]
MKALTLRSECLLSKWGFGDGDEPDALLDEMDARGMAYLTKEPWHAVLCTLVRAHLLPALDQEVEVVEIETNHNPIRATRVDGIDVEDEWYKVDAAVRLTPDHVDVPIDVVFETIQRERERPC